MDLNTETAPGCYFVDKSDINSALMTSHFCNHSDPTPAQMMAGEGKYMVGGLAERGGWQLWETEGYELIISQDFLPNVAYAHHLFYFYRPQTSVSHSVHGRGGLPQCMLGYTQPHADTHPQADTPWADTPWADTPQTDTLCPVHAEIHLLPTACWDRYGYCCGWYTSYWNAFLSQCLVPTVAVQVCLPQGGHKWWI